MSVAGRIPRHIWQALPNLQHLSLFDNAGLRGVIPSELGVLTQLRWLDLSHTSIDGRVRACMHMFSFRGLTSCAVARLVWLDLFAGTRQQIPTELGHLSGLTTLSLSHTKLTGPVRHSQMYENGTLHR